VAVEKVDMKFGTDCTTLKTVTYYGYSVKNDNVMLRIILTEPR
jgi:hypothetical protein